MPEIHKCKRCGNCCMTVGSTFWKHGNLDADRPFGDIAILNLLANNDKQEDDGEQCEMLTKINGIWSCAIEAYFGRKYKPVACQNFPMEPELCYMEQTEAGSI